ncbi:hypothetical protein VCHA53O466_50212 [Vibrio chagasii]|nr:hypothetical protein VCHA53O466_50212 [Vibrio chagasii]
MVVINDILEVINHQMQNDYFGEMYARANQINPYELFCVASLSRLDGGELFHSTYYCGFKGKRYSCANGIC